MTLSAADHALITSTATSKFETELQAPAEQIYQKFTILDTFGAEGYVPTGLGGLGPAQEWLDKRVLHAVAEWSVRFVGKEYENSAKVKKSVLRLSPVATAAKYAGMLAEDARGFSNSKIIEALKNNAIGFDKDELFGGHKYSDAVGAPTYDNIIAGAGSRWFLLNEASFVEATGTDYKMSVYGGENTAIDFMDGSIAFGWDATKIFAPAFWANSFASEATLTSANLRAAMAAQGKLKNDAGQRLGKKAKYLVVGQSNSGAAEALIKAALVDGGNTNVDMGRLELIVLDELED